MIQYALKCSEGHTFDSWFQSAEAYDKLAAAGMVTCAVCGCERVEKAIMTPRVRPARNAQPKLQPAPAAEEKIDVATPSPEIEKVLAEMRRHVEENSDYVGKDFASEARKIHLGEAPDRAIYGEAKPDEAKSLIEDGVPVAPLPFVPSRKTN
ncbi:MULTISPECIES: DUF1178 family protein [unclassified Ruegeria]|uniref:DUF1178 family protein n=1 Tax=unclassified Ruegeria TaxID=2625375 RepID=UPI001487F13F|nr:MULTISPECIES: DUF1178 family protein [unclassified Ruegeria]NOD77066.1 DUF1178 family protein [Ruegeria sp. HKCCD4332]NOD89537.1 DUF1178 family protein [Ruegeria sp. HKCCD4318]NOD92971.1 DUF1178 family protein [Ruegeria sp. HKCCD4884]NOE13860.1 DUF1178 family protein [Ruegeria sp. HKCCD4318-2]NOG08205.1 DUF1178 family protein [Ruegeria sp. HKCCD4315]